MNKDEISSVVTKPPKLGQKLFVHVLASILFIVAYMSLNLELAVIVIVFYYSLFFILIRYILDIGKRIIGASLMFLICLIIIGIFTLPIADGNEFRIVPKDHAGV